MAKDFEANPTDVKNFTATSEVNLDQHIQDYSEFLPPVNRSESLQRFFGSTVNQLLSSGSTQSIDAYWGRLQGRNYNPNNELFQPEPSAVRQNYQFQPGVVSRLEGNTQQTTSYINWLDRLDSLGADLNNHDRIFSEPGYVLDLPVNIDMMINYSNYYWLEGDIPLVTIEPSTVDNTIDIDEITRLSQYTTPVLGNYRSVEFVTGLRVRFTGPYIISTSGEYFADSIYYVENVGGDDGIKLVEIRDAAGTDLFPPFTPYYVEPREGWDTVDWDTTPWDGSAPFAEYDISTNFEREDLNLNKSYIVMERWAADKNPWARTNKWFSIHALRIATEYNDLDLEAYLNTRTRADRPIIEFDANMELYNHCKNLRSEIDYEFSIEQVSSLLSGVSEFFVDGENAIQVGDTILVATDDPGGIELVDYNNDYNEDYLSGENTAGPFSAAYSTAFNLGAQLSVANGAFTVIDDGGVFGLEPIDDPNNPGNPIEYDDGDYVVIRRGPQKGFIYCFDGQFWSLSQNKEQRGTPPLFKIYDENLVALEEFPNNDFAGDKVFGYKENPLGAFDRELGFKPSFTDQGSFANYEFEFTLSNTRYNQNVTVSNREEIRGYYYWNDCVTGDYYNGWSNIRGGQRVPIIQTQIADGINTVTFELGSDAVAYGTDYTVQLESGKYRWYENNYVDTVPVGFANPDHIWQYDTVYNITDLVSVPGSKLEFVNPRTFGTDDINFTQVSDTEITLSVDSIYDYDRILYRNSSDPTNYGEIFLTDINQNRYSVQQNGQYLREGVDYTLSGSTITITAQTRENDVFELQYIADADLENVVYDVAPVHFYNSDNNPFTVVGYDDLINHFTRQLVALPGFEGETSGINNYHRIRHLHQFDGLIRQQIFQTKNVQYLLDQESINPIRALKSFSNDYAEFKQFFINKVRQLWTTEAWESVRDLVDEAISQINLGKSEDFKYAHSDMAYFKQGRTTLYNVSSSDQLVFSLPQTVNQYGDTQNHLQVWAQEFDATLDKFVENPLVRGVDYIIDGPNITLLRPLELGVINVINGPDNVVDGPNNVIVESNVGTALILRWFDYKQISNIPFSAVKLGFFHPTQVEIVDGELIGHDGSRYTLTGTEIRDLESSDFDVVGAALWDFELRVFNNLVDRHFVEETLKNDMGEFYPTPVRNFAYDVDDLTIRLDDWYNRWAIRNNVTEIDDVEYDAGDEFTWNYNTVGPLLGSWRSLYVYEFGTDRPHTHPWEMLGHRVKPTWWDATYSWSGPNRAGLLAALKYGVTGNASTFDYVDVRYARPNYDWDSNTLVTDDGNDTLNPPVTAGVVTAPSAAAAAQPFVFGEWSEIENEWRKSSEYLFALAEVYLQLKPYRTHELFWMLDRWEVRKNVTQEQWIDPDTCGRTHIDELHSQIITDGIVSDIIVLDGGTGYTVAELQFRTDPECYRDLVTNTFTDAGSISRVSIVDPGRGFNNQPEVTIIGPLGSSGGEFEYRIDFDFVVTHLGFNSLPAEEFRVNTRYTNELATTINELDLSYMVHVGGYTDKRILAIEIDGDYESGLIRVPESSYDIKIDRNAPIKTVFYSGVKIEKIEGQGFRVEGYNLDSRFFNYLKPSTAGKQTGVQIGGVEVVRYFNWRNEVSRIPYRHIFTKRQELYQFLLGLAQYYESTGFDATLQWEVEAREAIEWTLDSTQTDPFFVNGIDGTLVYHQGPRGVLQTIDVNYDGVSNLLDSTFKNIRRNEMLVLRDEEKTEIGLKDGSDRLYGVGVRVIEFEHIIAIDNVTTFNDPIYQPEIGVGQNRVRLVGERTRNWNGRIEAPGYLVEDTGLILNFESSVRELETEWISAESKALERLTRQTIGFNVGYSKPTYMTNTFIGDKSAYRFEKGERKYQGTELAIEAMTRNKNIFGEEFEHELYEEWMVRLGEYGDVSESRPIQFAINPDKIKTDPQHYRLSEDFVSDKLEDLIVDISEGSEDAISGDYSSPFDVYPVLAIDNTSIQDLEQYQEFTRDAGLPLVDEIEYFLGTIDDIGEIYDPTEEYALIPNWSNTTAYVQGERVRLDGKVYRLAIEATGLTGVRDDVVIRGTQVFPTVANQLTFIANDTTVTFTKFDQNVEFDQIVIDGTVTNPTVPSGDTLVLDGITVNFIKTETTTTFSDIILEGGVTNPTITNGPGVTFDVGYANSASPTPLTTVSVAFDELDPNLIMQNIWNNALFDAGASNALAEAQNRLAVLEQLRVSYIAATSESAWESWINDYYDSTVSPNLYMNPEYVGAQINAAGAPSWQSEAEGLIQIDLDLIADLSGNPSTETVATMISGAFNDPIQFAADSDAANNLLDPLVTSSPNNENLRDFRTFVQNNGGTVIANGQLVPVTNPTDYVVDGVTDIVNKINTALTNAGAPSTITASPAGNIVTLSRTSNLSGYRLGVSTNVDLGFTAADNDVETQANTSTGPVDLTLDEVVVEISNARITGVGASNNGGRLQITSNNETLVIGTGTANNDLGISTGTFNANSNSTTVPVDLAIGDVVTQINAAAIENLTASQVEGALLLTYVGETLVIGEGTANTDLGIVAGTYDSLTEAVENVFNEDDWEIVVEPANFNIWTIDNIGSNPLAPQTTTNRYDVLNTVDFQIGVIEICAGSENGDDALCFTDTPHTLSVGDYVLIVNSTCVPSVDGIHQVTSIQDEQGFFIDRYIEEKGFTGKVFPLRSVRFPSDVAAENALLNDEYVQGSLGLRTDTYIYVDDVIDSQTNQSRGSGAVYRVNRTSNGVGLILIRDENGKTNNSTIRNGVLYSNKTGETVIRYELYDPLKGIIPGIAEAEIDLRSDVDFAYYNNSTNTDQELRTANSWGQGQVGTVWWDLSTAIYLNYDQDSPEYRQAQWGNLFPSASIDIYEWTKSPVTPDEYQTAVQGGTVIDGTELTGIPYEIVDEFGEVQYNWCEEIELNPNTNQIETYFYFWVRNKTTTPSLEREYSVLQLADIVRDPSTQEVDWIAATGTNTILVSSLTNARGFEDLVMQVNFDANESEYHQEFALLAENDPQLIIPEWLHWSLRDSLAGFTQDYTDEEYVDWDAVTVFSPGRVVKSGIGDFYRCHTEADNVNPDTDSNNDFWTRLQPIEENPDGDYNNVDIVRLAAPQSIPDLSLHPSVRYGIETRPHQIWFQDLNEARKNVVEIINAQLSQFNLINSDLPWREEFERTFSDGDLEYDLTEYWNFVDWSRDGFMFERGVGDYFLETEEELDAIANPSENEIAQVEESTDSDNRNRRSVWRYEDGAWALVYKEKATIRFNTLLWDNTEAETGWDVVGWDTGPWDASASAALVEIFNSFYYRLWVNEYYGLYADIWFYMAKYVLSEQAEVDWIFKSSYFKLIAEDRLEKQFSRFFNQNIDEFFDYVDVVKPFRSKLRDGIVRKTADEDVDLELLDTFEMRVQTNPVDSTIEEDDTRAFRLTVGQAGANNSSQILNKHKVLLGIEIGPDNLIIPYLNTGDGTLPNTGALWINGERIEYSGTASVTDAGIGSGFTSGFSAGFGGVTLINVTARGTQGTFARSHSYADVMEYEAPLQEPDSLPSNGDNLLNAWNSFGFSLLDTTNNTTQNGITINGTPLTITNITQANPAVVTVADTTGLVAGDIMVISGVLGMTEINFENSEEKYTIDNLTATTFELVGVDSTGYGAYTLNGEALVDRFGTIDLYGNILYAQWLALQEPANAIELFQNELEELIEVYWAQNVPWWSIDQDFVTIDSNIITIDGPGDGLT